MGSSNNGTASGGSGLKTARNLPGATASEVAATQLTSLRGWGTLRKVDRERAETYLRLVAEAELRRATTLPSLICCSNKISAHLRRSGCRGRVRHGERLARARAKAWWRCWAACRSL